MPAHDDDLLRPTLDADLDVRGYRKLFTPQSILWPTFFGGPLAGGILFGMNYDRMGRRDLALRTWIAAAVIALAFGIGVALYLLRVESNAAEGQRGIPRMARYVVSGLSVAMGWFVAKHQEQRFTAWIGAGNEPARLWLPGFAAWIVGGIVVVVATLATYTLFRAGI